MELKSPQYISILNDILENSDNQKGSIFFGKKKIIVNENEIYRKFGNSGGTRKILNDFNNFGMIIKENGYKTLNVDMLKECAKKSDFYKLVKNLELFTLE